MRGLPPYTETLSGMAATTTERYLRLMELVSRGYSWEDAWLLLDAPVSLDCILATVAPAPHAAIAA
jgi:hypothetical protein